MKSCSSQPERRYSRRIDRDPTQSSRSPPRCTNLGSRMCEVQRLSDKWSEARASKIWPVRRRGQDQCLLDEHHTLSWTLRNRSKGQKSRHSSLHRETGDFPISRMVARCSQPTNRVSASHERERLDCQIINRCHRGLSKSRLKRQCPEQTKNAHYQSSKAQLAWIWIIVHIEEPCPRYNPSKNF